MRTSEERISELHRRMTLMEQEKSRRRYRLEAALLCAACVVLTLLLAFLISQIPVRIPEGEIGGAAASIFAENEVLGYIVTAFLAFCLGALATILCFRLKRGTEEKKGKSDD